MSRRGNGQDSKSYADWLCFAQSDITAANLLTRNKKTLLLSAFHSHQAIEKTLKAFILCEKGYAPDGHNIIFLCRQAMKTEAGFIDWIDECIALNNYYIQTRYPPDFPLELNSKQAKNLQRMASDMYKYTVGKLDTIKPT